MFKKKLGIPRGVSIDSLTGDPGLGAHWRGFEPPTLWGEACAMANIAIPCAVSNVLEYLPVTFQLMFVGNTADHKAALDAVALGRAYFNASALSVGFGLLSALRTLCPQAVGARRPELCRLYAQRAVFLVFVFIWPSVILQFFASDVLKAIGQPPDIADMAGEYCMRLIPQLFAIVGFTILQRVMQALDLNWTNFAICAAVCALSPLVIWYYVVKLEMGYVGAAWAASTYNSLYCVIAVPVLIYQGHANLFSFYGWDVFDASGAVEYLGIAVPGLLQLCLEWWVLEIVTIMAGLLPDSLTAIGASSIVYNLEGLLLMLWVGNLVAVAIRVGFHIGAGDEAAARRAAWLGFVNALGLGSAIGVSLYLARRVIVTGYSRDGEVRARAARLMAVLAVVVVCDACNNAVGGIMNGLGLQRAAAKFQLVGYYMVGIPIAAIAVFALHAQRPLFWLWGGVAIAMCTSCALQVTCLFRHDWEESVYEAQLRLAERIQAARETETSSVDGKARERHRGSSISDGDEWLHFAAAAADDDAAWEFPRELEPSLPGGLDSPVNNYQAYYFTDPPLE